MTCLTSAEARAGFGVLLQARWDDPVGAMQARPHLAVEWDVSHPRTHAALPPPLWGRVGEGGSPSGSLLRGTPTPDPSPQGGGERTVCVGRARSLSLAAPQ